MNNKNVFILGAGFSKPIGIPSINEFYNSIKRIYLDKKSKLNTFLSKCFENVIAYRNNLGKVSAKTTIDLDNIETLFSYLEMDCECGDTGLNEIRKNLIYTIINTLDICADLGYIESSSDYLKSIKTYQGKEKVKYQKGKEINYNLNIYEYFSCLVSGIIGVREYTYKNDDTIITFNYDIVLDNIFASQSVPLNYCYEKESINNGLKYLKLHGSANWLLCSKCKKISHYGKGYPKDLIKGCKRCKDKNVTLEPLIVPPSWNKSEYREQINRIWETAIKEMNQARKIFIIGYSVPPTDMYFEYLISLGLKDNDIIDKIVVIDRDDDLVEDEDKHFLVELDSKYRKLLNVNFAKYRYEFLPIGVSNFIKRDLFSYIGAREK